MWDVLGILVRQPWQAHVLRACVVAGLAGCGQKGPLFIPTGPEASDRATLVETLVRPVGGSDRAPDSSTTAPPVKQP